MEPKMLRRSLKTAAATTASVLLMQAPALADTTLIDQTLPGPLGGAQVCVVGYCSFQVHGITNVRIYSTLQGGGVTSPPSLRTGSAPGCTANVNVAVTVATPGIGGTLHTVIEFDRTDMNGNVLSGSHEAIAKDVAVEAASQSVPLASVCATIL
jgi:hypothetical protein